MNTLTEAQRERVLTLLRQGKSLRRIEAETGHRRETIAFYGRLAGLLEGRVLALDPMRTEHTCDSYRERIADALERGASLRTIYTKLREEGFTGSYSTLKRFVRRTALRETMQMAA